MELTSDRGRRVTVDELNTGVLQIKKSCYSRAGATMKQLVRFGVSLDHHLLDDFDRHIQRRKYTNRSEALRDLIRDNLVGQE